MYDLKICMLIFRQHVGGNDDERRLFPFCSRRPIPGQPDVWTLRSPLFTISHLDSRLMLGVKGRM